MPEGKQRRYDGRPRHPEIHASGEELMSLIDGELPSFEQRRVETHLAACPECREMLRRYRTTASEFSSERLFHFLPTHPPLIPETAPFFSPETPSPRSWPRVSWAASIAVMVSGALLWQMIVAPPGVSARELIARARLEEQKPLVEVNEPVVHRTLRTTHKVGGVLREQAEYEETWRGAPGRLSRTDATSPIGDKVVQALLPHGCAEYAPLSVSMMECLAEKDSVRLRVMESPTEESASAYRLAMNLLSPAGGDLLTCEWTLRASDWRLTGVAFLFHAEPRNVEYAMEELSYRVVDLPLITHKKTAPSGTPTALTVPLREPRIPEPNSDEHGARRVEQKLAVLQTLAGLGWSAEDEIRFHWPEEDEEGRVDILATTEERKTKFLQRLEGMDGVAVRVRTYAEATAELPPPTDSLPASVSDAASTIQSEGPLLLELMAKYFGGGERGREQAISFSGNLIGITQDLQFQTKWLERVGRMIPADERTLLPMVRRRELQNLEAQMVRSITQRHAELHEMVSAVLCPAYCSARSVDVLSEAFQPVGDAPIPHGNLSDVLDREFALLKVMFVDRAFESVGMKPNTAEDAPNFAASWMEASRTTRQAIPAITAKEQSPVAAATPPYP